MIWIWSSDNNDTSEILLIKLRYFFFSQINQMSLQNATSHYIKTRVATCLREKYKEQQLCSSKRALEAMKQRKMSDLSSHRANWVWYTPMTFPKLITGHARPSNYSDPWAADELWPSNCSKQESSWVNSKPHSLWSLPDTRASAGPCLLPAIHPHDQRPTHSASQDIKSHRSA